MTELFLIFHWDKGEITALHQKYSSVINPIPYSATEWFQGKDSVLLVFKDSTVKPVLLPTFKLN